MIAKLNCPHCGAALTLTADIERFACGYCGAGLVQERRGGAIVLRALTEAISLVQQGTDKTAAELALQRFAQKRETLLSKRKALDDLAKKQATNWGCVVTSLVAVGVMLMAGENPWIGVGVCALAVTVWWASSNRRSAAEQREAVDGEIAAIEKQIAEKERIADGIASGTSDGVPSSSD